MAFGTVSADLIQTSTGQSLGAGNSVSMVNRIINSRMEIDQRNAGASVTPTASGYTLDRWFAQLSVASKYSVQQNAGSVTPPAGFTNYLGVTSTSAYSITSADQFNINQRIEGFNIADLGWGTANAKTVTLSFWVRSSLTGTFGGAITNSSVDRSYPFSFTISSANTWEQKSITVAGDTTGTWVTNNGIGIRLYINLGAGSTLSGTAGAWAAGTFTSATGATSVVGTSGATFYITGVDLRLGEYATAPSPDFRSYGQELALCQRYYWQQGGGQYERLGGGTSHATAAQNFQSYPKFPVEMRAIPSISTANITSTQFNGQAVSSVSIDTGGSSRLMAALGVSTSTGSFATGFAFHWETSNAFNVRLTYSAEL